MALIWSDDHRMLREAVSGFLDEVAPLSHFRELRDAGETSISEDLWRQMAEQGWTGIALSEDDGGSGFGFSGAGIVAEELGKRLTPSPFIASAVMASTAIAQFGSEEQKNKLSRLISGEDRYAFAMDERSRHQSTRAFPSSCSIWKRLVSLRNRSN